MDLGAVRAVATPKLAACAAGAAANARGLLDCGMLIAAVPFADSTLTGELLAMSQTRIAGILDNAQALAQDVDRLKQRGLYADIDCRGQVRLPSEVTEIEVAAQLRLAQQAVSSASELLDPRVRARIAHPPTEVVELCRALISAFAGAGNSRTPEAAAQVMLEAVKKARAQTTPSPQKPAVERRRLSRTRARHRTGWVR